MKAFLNVLKVLGCKLGLGVCVFDKIVYFYLVKKTIKIDRPGLICRDQKLERYVNQK